MKKRGATDKSMIIMAIGFDVSVKTQLLRIDGLLDFWRDFDFSSRCAAVVYTC
jgi:hypothetical protein